MTQHHKSAHKNFYYGGTSKRFASRLPAQGICLLSSFSLLSGGFVTAQSDTSSIDNIVPTIENSQPTAVTNPVQKEAGIPEIAKPQPDFSVRRVNLKKRLNSKDVTKGEEEDTQPTASVRISKPKGENTQPTASVRISKPKGENTQPTASVSEVDSVIKKLPELPQQANNSQDTAKDTENKPKDYNNAYIDTNEYKNVGESNYAPPSSVIVTERSSGCGATVSTTCAKPPQTPAVAKSQESSPTWLKKSEVAKVVNVSRQKQVSWKTITANSNQSENVTEAVASSVSKISQPQNQNNWRISRSNTSSHTKAAYHANNFIPSPREFTTTKVSSTPIAPQVGSLPAPMIEGNVAPRPSMVSYDFSLASVLPSVPYTNTLAYRGAGGGSGIVFPLSVAAPITSLFGWRVHPITGDHRFHAGTDLGAPTGTPILAAAKGQVESANSLGGYGLAVIINHGSAQQSLYGHMSEIFVQPGQWVEPGTVIGLVGSTGNSTGPHLHFEIRHLTQDGWVAVDPGVQLQGGLSQLAQATAGVKTAQAR
ncbi:M23 family metallopeptidase [Dolichospermum heterosporum]|uniref:M23 family metallopeptidase n=1 Tax=Dolichospermum heterosporum TAC447 TaxID=747523 RepID=A0ABY5LX88_9CYAN|nr:M23 family metallopeptidase [Dolichospermum heterosporum]UUO16285.1 M23 family metallopeptidase [Dolichospermum heterosporum TAC447]